MALMSLRDMTAELGLMSDKARADARDIIDQLSLAMFNDGASDDVTDVLNSASLYLVSRIEHRQDRREFGSSVEYLTGLMDLGAVPCGQ